LFDVNINALLMNLAPRLLAPKGGAARNRIQAALKEFYEAGYDQGPDVSPFVKDRAAAKRQAGADDTDLALGESEVPWGPLANTVPSFIWFFLKVFARPDYAEGVRKETAEVTRIEGDRAIIDVGKLVRQPFIEALGQEVLRLYNKQCAFREVMEDTVLQDADGREYLLQKGAGLQWFIAVRHMDGAAWGPDVQAFDPGRFLKPESRDEEKKQKQRGSMMPFGGGRHLCPGRRFALTNSTSTVCAMALLFDVEGVTVPPWRPGAAICAMARPAWEPGKQPTARLRRREGWEKMRLEFEVTSNYS
jgi:cytochrome P450